MNRHLDMTKLFDFDVGSLTKSPCRDCPAKDNLPQCMKDCRVLKRVQTLLSSGVSSTQPQTYYTVHMPSKDYYSALG